MTGFLYEKTKVKVKRKVIIKNWGKDKMLKSEKWNILVNVIVTIRPRTNSSDKSNRNLLSINTRQNDEQELIILEEHVKINYTTVHERMDKTYWGI